MNAVYAVNKCTYIMRFAKEAYFSSYVPSYGLNHLVMPFTCFIELFIFILIHSYFTVYYNYRSLD